MRAVFVGDMHAVPSELDECRRLADAIREFARVQGATHVVFLGDQHHAHATMRVEVMAFWKWVFRELTVQHLNVIALVGNHDRADQADDASPHAMLAYRDDVDVIESPRAFGGVLFLPYMASKDEFVSACNAQPTKIVVCHQSFDTTQYENGSYVGEEGVDPEAIPQRLVISGHIHKPQRVGKVWYVGAPRWRSAADANEERRVWCVDLTTGEPVASMDTAPYCRRIVTATIDCETSVVLPEPGPLVDLRLTLVGTTDWVNALAAAWADRGARVAVVRTDAVRLEVRESEGVPQAWSRFVGAYRASRGTPPARIAERAREYGL